MSGGPLMEYIFPLPPSYYWDSWSVNSEHWIYIEVALLGIQ